MLLQKPFLVGVLVGLMLAIAGFASPLLADEPRWDVGIRANIMGGTGFPTNDVLGAGAFARYRFKPAWAAGFAIDTSSEFDFERPYASVGVVQDPSVTVIDAVGSSVMISGWIERQYTRQRHEWFWTAGLGINDIDMEPATGPTDDGGTFNISTDAGTQFLVSTGGGYRRALGQHWWIEAALRLEWHEADWRVTDSVSGNTGTVDGHRLLGVGLGFGYRF